MWKKLLLRIESIGVSPDDDADLRLHKSLLVVASLMFMTVGIFWGFFFPALDETFFYTGLIPLGYGILSPFILFWFSRSRNYETFRFIQLFLTLTLPFGLQLLTGGYLTSGVPILWAIVSPLGALLFGNLAMAYRWFAAYIGLIVFSGLIQPYVPENNLSQNTILMLHVINLSGVFTLVFSLFRYFSVLKNRAYSLLSEEQKRSEKLLLNVLPEEIAPLLKEKTHADDETIAEQFESVTVLFADVVGFTPLSTELTPRQMVELLNEVFSYFDVLVEKYALEKIRTIGDNYMVVSGAPRRRENHAQVMAKFALEMLHFRKYSTNALAPRIQFRVGMNSGPAIAAVIGHTKFHYDLWGDAVNIASRMESHGEPGRIQIAPGAYALLKDEFNCESRGVLEIKGKGQMETWFLTGVRETVFS